MEVLKRHQRSQRSRAVPKRRIHPRIPRRTWWLGMALNFFTAELYVLEGDYTISGGDEEPERSESEL